MQLMIPGAVGLSSTGRAALLVPSLQYGVCTWLKPDKHTCVLGGSQHVTVKVVNSCVACLKENITEAELKLYSEE